MRLNRRISQTTACSVDQAEGLRQLGNNRPVKVVTVTGGKGGVGKSSVCANLGVAMAMMGRRVMLLDGDLGLANIDVMFGLHPQQHAGRPRPQPGPAR